MKNEKLTIEQAETFLKQFENSFYWLQALVNHKNITKKQAGYILTRGSLSKGAL